MNRKVYMNRRVYTNMVASDAASRPSISTVHDRLPPLPPSYRLKDVLLGEHNEDDRYAIINIHFKFNLFRSH